MIRCISSEIPSARQRRLVSYLFGETSSTMVARLAPAAFLAVGFSWLSHPAQAENFNVATDSQLRSAISNTGNGDTITFTTNITLGGNLPVVKKDITFNGGNFTLSGDGKYRDLFVDKDNGTDGRFGGGGGGGGNLGGAGGGGGSNANAPYQAPGGFGGGYGGRRDWRRHQQPSPQGRLPADLVTPAAARDGHASAPSAAERWRGRETLLRSSLKTRGGIAWRTNR